MWDQDSEESQDTSLKRDIMWGLVFVIVKWVLVRSFLGYSLVHSRSPHLSLNFPQNRNEKPSWRGKAGCCFWLASTCPLSSSVSCLEWFSPLHSHPDRRLSHYLPGLTLFPLHKLYNYTSFFLKPAELVEIMFLGQDVTSMFVVTLWLNCYVVVIVCFIH